MGVRRFLFSLITQNGFTALFLFLFINSFKHYRVSRQRSSSATILIGALFGVLVCAVLAAEFPELITLSDNVSNDFTIRRGSPPQTATKLGAASYDASQPFTKDLGYSDPAGLTSSFEAVKSTSSSLCILLCTLRT